MVGPEVGLGPNEVVVALAPAFEQADLAAVSPDLKVHTELFRVRTENLPCGRRRRETQSR